MSSDSTAPGPPGCPSCGAPIDPSSRFCTACGAPLRAAPRHRTLAAALASALVVAVVVGVMWWGGGDESGPDGPTIEADPAETTTTSSATTTSTTTEVAPPTTDDATTTTIAPVTTLPDATEPPDDPDAPIGPPGFFPTPEEAIADHLSLVSPPFAGPCADLAGREAELGGTVTCSVLDQDLRPQQIHRWGVFATDDLRGWLFLDVGSAGWSVADESFELEPPSMWFP